MFSYKFVQNMAHIICLHHAGSFTTPQSECEPQLQTTAVTNSQSQIMLNVDIVLFVA